MGGYVGRHRRPAHSLRNTAIVATAVAGGVGTLFVSPASADPLDGCTAGSHNPTVRVCQDRPETDGSDSLHALVRLDPLCVHVAIPDRHRAIGTRDCNHPVGVVPVYPAYPGQPGETAPAPCSCTTPAPGTPVVPVVPVVPVQPGSETPGAVSPGETAPVETAPVATAPLPEAPAPVIVNNNTNQSGAPLPPVTH